MDGFGGAPVIAERLDIDVDGLPQDMIDEDVTLNDKRTRMSAIEQILLQRSSGNQTIVHADTDLLGMRPEQFVGDEVRERDGGFDARQDAIAKMFPFLLKPGNC